MLSPEEDALRLRRERAGYWWAHVLKGCLAVLMVAAAVALLSLGGCVACGGPFGSHRSDDTMIGAMCSGVG